MTATTGAVHLDGFPLPPAGNGGAIMHKMSMKDFADNGSSVWRMVDYDDEAGKTNITRQLHEEMLKSGETVHFTGEDYSKVAKAYPDLRTMKKTERTPVIRQGIQALKSDLRNLLQGLRHNSYEFEVNGNVLETKLYNTGIREVLDKLTKDKAAMLYRSEDIFQNAKYLYSTPDYDSNPDIYRWNYFYTPVALGSGDIVGVKIAVRDMVLEEPGSMSSSQIYNWGIKKESTLAGERPGPKVTSFDSSSVDLSNNSIPQPPGAVKGLELEPMLRRMRGVIDERLEPLPPVAQTALGETAAGKTAAGETASGGKPPRPCRALGPPRPFGPPLQGGELTATTGAVHPDGSLLPPAGNGGAIMQKMSMKDFADNNKQP